MAFGIAIIIVGIAFLLKNLGFIDGSVWPVIWPVLMILVGVSLMLRGRFCCCGWHKKDKCGCGEADKKQA